MMEVVFCFGVVIALGMTGGVHGQGKNVATKKTRYFCYILEDSPYSKQLSV